MTHEELLAKIPKVEWIHQNYINAKLNALRAVVELHKPLPIVNGDNSANCCWCQIAGIRETPYPCPTIQAIEKELL